MSPTLLGLAGLGSATVDILAGLVNPFALLLRISGSDRGRHSGFARREGIAGGPGARRRNELRVRRTMKEDASGVRGPIGADPSTSGVRTAAVRGWFLDEAQTGPWVAVGLMRSVYHRRWLYCLVVGAVVHQVELPGPRAGR